MPRYNQPSSITISEPILDALQSLESGVILGENILLPKVHCTCGCGSSCTEYNRHSARGGEPRWRWRTVPRLAWAQLMESQHTSHIFPPKTTPGFAYLLDLVSTLPRLVYRALRFHWGCPEPALRQRVTGPRGRSPH
ncbi:hypothetical protein N7516_008729 [Penicillium verrucosum]|uniref:uncharacterized protein n=1 Tax=Penicillium verrucosum TaxID=60171 RepID=UPI0025458AF1|nr:uncharacterized protein N7516_008729 [Penicillium verrucosum]KAJ5926956.1 hypothetical protein N7516_008729 [Penicillium verrucosum]